MKFKTEIQYLIDQLDSTHSGANVHAKANVKELLYILLDIEKENLASSERISERLETIKAKIRANNLL